MSDSVARSNNGEPTAAGASLDDAPVSSGQGTRSVPLAASATMTMTVDHPNGPPAQTNNDEILRLRLENRPSVNWENGVIDNEGMGRKSSKRCCIFHKPRPFGESSSDTSDYDSDDNSGDNRKVARKKLPGKKKIPDNLRFHA